MCLMVAGPGNGMHFAVLVDEAPGMPGERMGENVAGPQKADGAFDNRVAIHAVRALGRQGPELAEMDIDRQIRIAADLACHFHDRRAPAREPANLGMRLYALDEIAVRFGGGDGRRHIDAARRIERRIIMAFEAADEVGGNERVAAACGLLGDEVAKAWKRHRGSTALVDQCRHAAFDAYHVRFEAEAPGDIAIDVRMGVDHPRQDQLTADINDLVRR
jgi:hypothetical protein